MGFAFLLIGYWLLLVRGKFRAFPPAHNWFVALIVLHSLVVYGLLYPGELEFSTGSATPIDESVMFIEQGRGTYVIRFFFNVITAYAVAASIRSRREMKWAGTWLGLGFISMLLIGSRSAISYSEGFYRETGGFLNPNDFGAAAMAVAFASAFVLLTPRRGFASGTIALASLLAGGYGVVASASRSYVGGLAIGFLVLFYYSRLSQKLRYLAVGILLSAAVALLLTDQVYTALEGRFSPDTIRDTRGSMRMDIYRDYLIQFPRYAWTGVGLKRSTEVTKDTFSTYRLFIPHSAYIEKMVEFGCLGLLLFVLSLVQFFRILKSPMDGRKEIDRRDVIMLGLFLAWAAICFVGSGDSRMYWFSWAMIASQRAYLLQAKETEVSVGATISGRSIAS